MKNKNSLACYLLPLYSMDFSFFPLLLLLILSYLIINSLRPSKRIATTKTTSSGGFKCYPFLGTIPEFLANRHRYFDWTTAVLSAQPTNTSIFRRPGVSGVITANPLIVEHMLKTNFSNYPKGSRSISLLQDFLGSGIFNSDGESWRLQRKTASFEFNKRSLRNFVVDSVRFEIQTRLVPLLKNHEETGQVLDLQDVLERFAFDNVCKVAFNLDPGCLSGGPHVSGEFEFMKMFEAAATLSAGRFFYALPFVWRIKKFFNIGSEKKLRESIKTVHEFAATIIRTRLEENSGNYEDLLSRFIDKEGNSPEFLRDIVVSFILAGRDTTSSGLSWFFWLLSLHPEAVRKIRSEIKTVRSRCGKQVGEHTYDLDQLREMNYLHAAITEAMRLYPPVPVDTRQCLEDDILPDGTMIKKGWFISYDTYAMGRMKGIWGEDCEKFRPERWIENGLYKQESPFRYPVFHAGPRICLGKEMAYIQMKSIAACVIEQFEVDVVGKDERPEHQLSITLRMRCGLPVRVLERKW